MLHIARPYAACQLLVVANVAYPEGLAHVHILVPFSVAAVYTVPCYYKLLIRHFGYIQPYQRIEYFEGRCRRKPLYAAVFVIIVYSLVIIVPQYEAAIFYSIFPEILTPFFLIMDAGISTGAE